MKIMVSACLLGENCKYNGGNNLNRGLILHYGEESALHILSRENEGTVIYSRIPKDKLTSADDPEK